MSTFADRVQSSIEKNKSYLVAGCDPVLETLPSFLLEDAEKRSKSDADFFERVLSQFAEILVSSIEGRVAAIKPNIAFFEQYGLHGLSAFSRLCDAARERSIPVIADAKRGDIGSTAAAYSAAFLRGVSVGSRTMRAFHCDALTINPFLGFDTLEPFLKDAQECGKGLFILVQTSNPGAKALQGLRAEGVSVSEHVARWIATNAEKLQGSCGWSGVGAVVGASYPDEARKLREVMPRSIFLIPGLGAQGADAKDSVAGFGSISGKKGGALVNVSRGLIQGQAGSAEEFRALIATNADRFNAQIQQALE
jgi:orotidine-5'-phosphate decarboxylase